ncbi:MAG: metallophosphoesterase [Acutalibacteraceae bacterium]|nr:metallophosphoesterase [Acutalibacteraceae bacterium]
MKKIIALMIACVMLMSSIIPASAAKKENKLQFDKNGEFKVLHLCDCQDGFPAQEKMFTYINYMLENYKPDLVVLGGDNTVGEEETKEKAIEELVAPFVEHETYFTLVFGNHDHQQNVEKEELLEMYQKYGGKYCLAYDADPDLTGVANHNLPIYSSNGEKLKFNLWLIDSLNYATDENGNEIGYDSVREDQIEWYKDTYKKLEKEAGEKVYSLCFQHIVPGEVYDVMFPEVKKAHGPFTETYNNGKHYNITAPDTSAFTGFLFEAPCPGIYNYGQVDAMVETGDVLSILFGHDHINSYEIEYEGIKLINTPGVTYNSYGNEFVRGSRLITIKEDATDTFESEVITVNEVAYEDEDFREAMGISKLKAGFWIGLGNVLLGLAKASGYIAKMIY